jgi:hypothetical protein
MQAPRLVFLDETWATTRMTPTRGRAPKGQRCRGRAPHGHWHTTTFVCALRHDALMAPCVLDGPVNGETFRAWVEQFLAAELRPGDIVVMDNLGSHKVAGVRQAIEARGASVRYLPPYSPDFNPIEQVNAQAQDAFAQCPRAYPRLALAHHRQPPRSLLSSGMRQLHPPLWLWHLRMKML